MIRYETLQRWWWEEIGRDTLTVAGDTLSVTGLPARAYLKCYFYANPTGGTASGWWRFNNDSGANYYRRVSDGGAADATNTGQGAVVAHPGTNTYPRWVSLEVLNIAANKMGYYWAISGGGTNNAPERSEGAFKWQDTTIINRIDVVNSGTGDFDAGAELIVLGHD